jgi:hypothetical protein
MQGAYINRIFFRDHRNAMMDPGNDKLRFHCACMCIKNNGHGIDTGGLYKIGIFLGITEMQ